MEPIRFPQPTANRFERNLLRAKVLKLIKERSFFQEKIMLASGVESDFYFDMKPTMFSPDGAAALGDIILDRLSAMDVDYVGGLAMGAVPLVTSVSMRSHETNRPLPGFFVRQEIKDHGTKKLIEGLAPGESLKGKRVVILDDVTTTGGSAMRAVDAARNAGAAVILVLSVVDRKEGATARYARENIPFDALFTADDFLNS